MLVIMMEGEGAALSWGFECWASLGMPADGMFGSVPDKLLIYGSCHVNVSR